MWTRADLKARGKADIIRNYWACILISLIIAILSSGVQSVGGSFSAQLPSAFTNNQETEYKDYNDGDHDHGYSEDHNTNDTDGFKNGFRQTGDSPMLISLIIILFMVIGFFGIVGIAFSAFVAGPLVVGGRRFFLENQNEKCKIDRVGYSFKKGRYGNTVLTIFLKGLFLVLWSLLFVIPGIVKSYSYWMIDYMMAENPTLNHKRAFEISQQTMRGQKWNVFVLDLSFILWNLLSIFTCGLLNIFYLNSYKDATKARLYAVLRMNALNLGYASMDELPGYIR